MKCPHCGVEIHDESRETWIDEDKDGAWSAIHLICPACKRVIVYLLNGKKALSGKARGGWGVVQPVNSFTLVYPRAASRPACPAEVPVELAEDYREACLVIHDSAKASAALSRRCLQHLLRQYGKVKAGNLADEIQQLLDSRALPSHLAGAVDGIRNIGNFAAHPMKSETTGEVLAVEPGEAEWNLDVLESLFDFYFVQPAILASKRDALNKKLAEGGKPPMKQA